MAVDEAHRLAEELVTACRRTLHPLAGTILHGSLASGDFVPGKSDVDVLAIVEGRPSDDQLSALTIAVADVRGHAATPADLRVVTTAVAAAPPPSPPMEVYIRIDPASDPGLEVETR